MTTPELNPVVQQRKLRAELRAAREVAGYTQVQVAEEMDWSTSKVIRIETNAVGLSITDLRGLLQLYGVDDREVVAELVEMGKASKRRAWWDNYREYIGDLMVKYIGLESSASRVRQYQDNLVPGLLQIPAYARAILTVSDADPGRVEKKVEVRAKRQSILDPGSGMKFFFIVEEAVLRRHTGGLEVMREQLERIREVGRQENVVIRVLPFTAGANLGVQRGSFAVFEYPGGEQDHIAVLERPGFGVLLRDDAEEVSEYVEAFLELEELSTRPEELDEVVDRLIRELS